MASPHGDPPDCPKGFWGPSMCMPPPFRSQPHTEAPAVGLPPQGLGEGQHSTLHPVQTTATTKSLSNHAALSSLPLLFNSSTGPDENGCRLAPREGTL